MQVIGSKNLRFPAVILAIACVALINLAAVYGKANVVSVAVSHAMELEPSVSLKGPLQPSQVFASELVSGEGIAQTPLLQLSGASSCRYRTATVRGAETYFTEDHRWTRCTESRAFLQHVFQADLQASAQDTAIIVEIQNYSLIPPKVTLASMSAFDIFWYRAGLSLRGPLLSHALINSVPANWYALSRWMAILLIAVPILAVLAIFDGRR